VYHIGANQQKKSSVGKQIPQVSYNGLLTAPEIDIPITGGKLDGKVKGAMGIAAVKLDGGHIIDPKQIASL
jgi:hypothetical protein